MNKLSKKTKIIGTVSLLIICLLLVSLIFIPKPKEKKVSPINLEMYSNSTSTNKTNKNPIYSSFYCGYINNTVVECPLGYDCVSNPKSNSTSTDTSGICATY